MDKLDKLFAIARKESIRILYEDLYSLPENISGLYMYNHKVGPIIVLDKRLEHMRRDHKCVLAEEIGHFYTAPRTNSLSAYTCSNHRIMMSQDERKALQWGTDFLIPDAELCEALKSGHRSCFELADYFDVTEWFMYQKLGFLKMCFRRTGLKVKGRDLFDVQMQPCFQL